MKIRFFNNVLTVLTFLILQLCYIVGIVLAIHENFIILLIIVGLGFLIQSIIIVVLIRKHFYKVQIDREGITWFFRKRDTVFIRWEDVDLLRASTEWGNRSIRVDSKMIDNNNLYFNVNFIRLKRIINICPIDDLKLQLIRNRIFYTESKNLNNKDK